VTPATSGLFQLNLPWKWTFGPRRRVAQESARSIRGLLN